jgi:hypothetical protein
MVSRITGNETEFLFTKRVLNKYEVSYYRCKDTGYVQTEEPYWLKEAYESAITQLDIGLAQRNITLTAFIDRFIPQNFNARARFLDYAGGYGLLTRLLRDKGYDFWSVDHYCKNLFSPYNDLACLKGEHRFEMVTAFELMEHFEDPLQQIQDPLQYSDHFLFSTELIPDAEPPVDWWYWAPETGQHVSFYTLAALQEMAKRNNRRFYSNGKNLHLFTTKKFDRNPFPPVNERLPFFYRKIKKLLQAYENKHRIPLPNLAEQDYQEICKMIRSEVK